MIIIILLIIINKLNEHGDAFDYYVIKCHPITKPEFVQKASKVFWGLDDDAIERHRVLGSVIGSDNSCNDFKITTNYILIDICHI